MNVTAYTLSGCSACRHLKELFRRAETEYTEVVVNRDMSKEEFVRKYPSVTSYPFVVIDDTPIGGLVETVKLFVKEGLVSSTKKE